MSLPPRARVALALVTVLGIHAALVMFFLPPEAVWRPSPMAGDDFDTHIGQAYRVLRALDQAGEHWGYTPELLAGYPAGVIFDADNKGWAYFTYALWKGLGVPPGRAFNLFVLSAMSLSPLVVFLSARLFRFSGYSAVCAAAFGSLYWFFDSFVHWCWWIGMVAYSFAAYVALLPMAAFYRYMRTQHPGWAALTALLLGPSLTLHPYTFFIIALPMGTMYLRNARGWPLRVHLTVAAIAAFAIAFNLPWLLPSLAHWHYILDSGFFAQGGLDFLLADLFNQLISPTDTGVIGTRATLRFLFGFLGVVGLWHWKRAGDDRFLPLCVALGAMYGLSYLGPIIPFSAQIQPYRHVVPAGFVAALPAASLVDTWFREHSFWALSGVNRAMLAIALFFAGQRVLSDVIFFVPPLWPQVRPLIDGAPSPIEASGYPYPATYALPHAPSVHAGVDHFVGWASKEIGRGGRLLVEEMALGERLAWRAGLEVIGGFRLRNLAHSHANLFRTHQGKRISAELLSQYVRTFAIDYIVAAREHPELDEMPELLESIGPVHERRVYRVRVPHGKVIGGTGTVDARFNQILVRDTDPTRDLVLSYHYHPRFRCGPACRVERADNGFDDVGFLRIPAPHPAAFALKLRY